MKKINLALDGWIKEVAPRDRLRKWFGHEPRKWKGFRKQYFAELRVKAKSWQPILERARRSDVTLLYGARDSDHNNTLALKDFLTPAKEIKVKVYKQVAPSIGYVTRRGENHVHTIANTAGWIEDG